MNGGSGKRLSGEWLERLPLLRGRPALAVALMLGLVCAGLTLRFAADPMLPPGFPYVTFFPVVIISSFLFGTRIGGLSALLCGLLAWYFFIPPAHTFQLHGSAAIALGFYAFVVVTDILLVHWMQRATHRLAAERERNRMLAETRETLFRELQHRVSNNLQVAAALLALQKKDIVDEVARASIEEAARRLGVIGRISRQLYDPDGAARGLLEFLTPLCADVVDASGRAGISLDVFGDGDARIDPEIAVPVALIVAEAVANAIEHGFAGRERGAIRVEARGAAGLLVIEVVDDGEGLPPDFDPATSESLGLRLARVLAGQIGGSFELTGGDGCRARLSLARDRDDSASGRRPDGIETT